MVPISKIFKFIRARYAPRGARPSYSRAGEDRIMRDLLDRHGIASAFYVDIGSHHPVFGNNTCLFYREGGHGALIEPNSELCAMARRMRPRDLCIEAGAGGSDGEADFYGFPQSTRSTFSRDQAEGWAAKSHQPYKVSKRRLLSLDTIISEHCGGRAPDIVSIDAEGLDIEILSGFSWVPRPKIFCVEMSPGIEEIFAEHGYDLKAKAMENSIFIDSRI